MLTYAALREIQKKEMESAAIVPVEENFYQQLAHLLERKKEEAQQSNSLLTIREYENIKKITQSIQSKREEKMALMALRGAHSGEGLALEERTLLEKLLDAIEESRRTVKMVWESERVRPKIRILKEVEQYKGVDEQVYGPFKPGEELELPKEETDWLLKAQLAKLVA
ncbi:MAG TPA: hypothetical protein VJH24_05200 [Candidatus Bilamarchaeaceae archaeon]|nr:hypothetical protein [Candidatus Bilamarchaeaceae archaeon]